MDEKLNEEFQHIKFSPEVVQMFEAILKRDDVHRQILKFIARKRQEKENVSILQLIENIKTNRRVKILNKKGFHYEQQETLIDRKSAERIVDKLASMSLIHYKYMTPYKLLYLTHRGLQLLQVLEQNQQILEEEGE